MCYMFPSSYYPPTLIIVPLHSSLPFLFHTFLLLPSSLHSPFTFTAHYTHSFNFLYPSRFFRSLRIKSFNLPSTLHLPRKKCFIFFLHILSLLLYLNHSPFSSLLSFFSHRMNLSSASPLSTNAVHFSLPASSSHTPDIFSSFLLALQGQCL